MVILRGDKGRLAVGLRVARRNFAYNGFKCPCKPRNLYLNTFTFAQVLALARAANLVFTRISRCRVVGLQMKNRFFIHEFARFFSVKTLPI